MKPVVGITARHADPTWIAKKTQRYIDAIRAAGGEPLVLAPETDTPDAVERIDALLLSGGDDLDPQEYGQANAGSEGIDPARDALELGLVRAALARDLPVLGICRGFQLLNVVCGGSLVQDLPGHLGAAHADGDHDDAPHDVEVFAGNRLAALVGSGPARVNSYHHQAVTPERLAPSLVAVARAGDVVEGVESSSHRWVLAVQWHPERYGRDRFSSPEAQKRLFEDFVIAAGAGNQASGSGVTE